MQILVSNILRIKSPTPEMALWCAKNLRIDNPDYAKKLRMGFWVGNTPKVLDLFETDGTDLILPFGVLRDLPAEIVKDAEFITDFADPVIVDYHSDIADGLLDYQKKAVDAMVKAHYGILKSPAGSGKTQMGIALATILGRRTLWMCHTLDLVRQSRDRALRYMDKSLIGEITGGKVNIGKGITFATIQTMAELDLSRYKDVWDVIITDEVHRVSGTATAVTRYEHVLNSLSARHKYGLSATVHRSDGMIKATFALVGNVVYEVPREAVRALTMDVGIFPIGTGCGMPEKAYNTDGTMNYTRMISGLCEDANRNIVITDWLKSHADHPSLILSDRLEHLEMMMALLPSEMADKAVMISGRMTSKAGREKRRKALEDMRTGRKKYLFATYSLAKEGLDVPCLERLYLTTPQKDSAVVEQSIGRIARVCEGKKDAIAYDFIDDIGYCIRAYKRRKTTYRKIGCYFPEEDK